MLINPISYPGNKNRIIDEIVPYIDTTCSKFVDIFCGGGTVAANSGYKDIVYNDTCEAIIDLLYYFYTTKTKDIILNTENIIKKYNLTYSRIYPKGTYKEYKHEGLSLYNKEGFNLLKKDYNDNPTSDKLFALLIYSFNHYIRYNKKKEFNIPVGKVDFSQSIYNNTKKFCDGIKNLNIEFYKKDFRDKELYQDKNAFYYFDPPYLITKAPYNVHWDTRDEIDLLNMLDYLNNQNIKFLLSNVIISNGKINNILEDWAKKYTIIDLNRQYRNANYQKVNITDSREVLIKNY